jgi:hypothetical protein
MFFFFCFVGNLDFFFFSPQGTILSSTRPGEKPKRGGRYLGSGRAETKNRVGDSVEYGFHSADRVRVRRNRVGDSLVSRTGFIRWTAHESDTPVRLSLCLYDSAFASCFSIETKKTQKKNRLVCCCRVRCRDLISCGGRTHSCGCS